MRESGLELLAIYHSHPSTGPVPSQRDLKRNHYGDSVVHLIVSLAASPPEVRGWWLNESGFREAEWRIVN
jgi:proteasome lid subunit RPN8/RPN11